MVVGWISEFVLGYSLSTKFVSLRRFSSKWTHGKFREWNRYMSMHTMRMPTFLKQQQEEQTWRKQPTGSIAGSTVLIIGLGAIGAQHIAVLAS